MSALAHSVLRLDCIDVCDYSARGWNPATSARARALEYCRYLEEGKILFFRRPPFSLPTDDYTFLIRQQHAGSMLRKNISYRPAADRLRGYHASSADQQRMQQVLGSCSAEITSFVSRFLMPYADRLCRGYASFRPVEEQGRNLPRHKRNDLLHIDAFPSRPTRGGRILRVFTNLHPFRKRVWDVGGPFRELAERYAEKTGTRLAGLLTKLVRWLRAAGLPLAERSPYDRVMLRLHNLLKEDRAYQAQANPRRVEFPPMSTWLVFTDGLPHAVLSGQFAIEQTFVVPIEALVSPQHSPLRILEGVARRPLA
ncbi:MAG TPA: Kdo hydroxylase family protein [Terracidiphilus sp.]|nr:Kdo hydroxylase family protein [Terracidiphilus sp.]